MFPINSTMDVLALVIAGIVAIVFVFIGYKFS